MLDQGAGGSSPCLPRLLLRPGGAAWGEGGAASAGLSTVSVEGAGGGRGHLLITPAEPDSSLRVSPFRCLNHQLRPQSLPLASTCPSVFSGFSYSFILLMIFQRQMFLLLMKSNLFYFPYAFGVISPPSDLM